MPAEATKYPRSPSDEDGIELRPLLQKSRSLGCTGRTSSSKSLRDHLRRSSEGSESSFEGPSTLDERESKQKMLEKSRNALLFSVFLVVLGTGVGVTAGALCTATDQFMVAGAGVSCLFSLSILASYSECARLRKYPNQLIVHKTVIDLALALVNIVQFVHAWSPMGPSQTTSIAQGLLFAGEFWFCAMSVDLIQSVTNPFSSFSYNLQVYRLCSVLLGVVGSVVLPSASPSPSLLLASLPVIHHKIQMSWVIYYVSVACSMLVSFGCFVYVQRRLATGLEETFDTRKKVLAHGLLASVTYISWSLIALALVASTVWSPTSAESFHVVHLHAFVHAARSLLNILVWVLTNGRDLAAILCVSPGHASYHRRGSDEWTVENADELLKPQLNLALRRQLIQMATKGIVDAVEHYLLLHRSIRTNQSFALDWDPKQRSTSVSSVDFDVRRHLRLRPMEEMHFEDFQPRIFATVRALSDIDDHEYLRSFRSTANERLSEGRSGAFVFTTSNRRFLVKSMTKGEKSFLISIMPAYVQYLKWNPSTLLPRFYGVHAMKLYGKMFYVVVMANIFPSREVIHRRYDIKGSWIDRNAPVCVINEKYRCANCNRQFVFGGQEACSSSVGEHYPDITLRDNDLKKRIKLPRETSHAVLKQIARDSDFLCGLGIMDYSLLIGMHYSQFKITKGDDHRTYRRGNDSPGPTSKVHGSFTRWDASPQLTHRSRFESHSLSSNKRLESSLARDDDADITDSYNPSSGFGYVNHRYNADVVSGPSAYYIGIIDILQRWTLSKQLERVYKVHVLQKNGRGISAIHPNQYAKRFQMKMCQLLYQPEDGEDD
ncbi:hypothetical protein, variant [Aphanomyces invadans]|uniref:PIPK domain-containing protein n=1 Tax=Aphanomyces invadans TaxID=157072 RepID=A0A024TLF9_9STRA|nr:hypothetical protein, variant [Aphanomyces invadans]ETV94197.1 hypothetical protein, variant [Aphanomyces invadans]|eukprot:XP_008876958.1 hypothetical protein, variant [Aphanomyces invadans]